jgi:CDP-diacylglycerol--serine O-phosphatidyltransferase
MNIKKHIPNAITCGNLLCGCFGIIATFNHRLDHAFYLVITAAILDFFDGFVARLLKVSSPIGKDLDSLADMVTFGVLPGFIMYQMLISVVVNSASSAQSYNSFYSIIAFLIPVFSAIRLAKFNNDPRQTDAFIGVATPANTLLISSLGYLQYLLYTHAVSTSVINQGVVSELLTNIYALSGLTVLMSYLLIAEIPLFALKFKNFGWADNKIRYVLLISAVVLLILFQLAATPFIIFLYIFLSIINNIIVKKKTVNT